MTMIHSIFNDEKLVQETLEHIADLEVKAYYIRGTQEYRDMQQRTWMYAALRTGRIDYVKELVELKYPLHNDHNGYNYPRWCNYMHDAVQRLSLPLIRWLTAQPSMDTAQDWGGIRMRMYWNREYEPRYVLRNKLHNVYRISQYYEELYPDRADLSVECWCVLLFFEDRDTDPEISYCLKKLREYYIATRGVSRFLSEPLQASIRAGCSIAALDWLLEIFPNKEDFAIVIADGDTETSTSPGYFSGLWSLFGTTTTITTITTTGDRKTVYSDCRRMRRVHECRRHSSRRRRCKYYDWLIDNFPHYHTLKLHQRYWMKSL